MPCWCWLGTRQHQMPHGAVTPAAPTFTAVSNSRASPGPHHHWFESNINKQHTIIILMQLSGSPNKWAVPCLASNSLQRKTPPGFSSQLCWHHAEDREEINHQYPNYLLGLDTVGGECCDLRCWEDSFPRNLIFHAARSLHVWKMNAWKHTIRSRL